MNKRKKITSSLENYIRAISEVSKIKKASRAKDISQYLNVGPSSVSEALKILSDKKLINYEPYGIITLAPAGEKIAKNIEQRHTTICDFFQNVLLIDEKDVEINAFKLQHEISNEALDKFIQFLDFMKTCSCKEPKWLQSFKYYAENGELKDKCTECIKLSKETNNKQKGCSCKGCS